MLGEMAASLYPSDLEAGCGQGGDDFLPGQPPEAAHDATLIVSSVPLRYRERSPDLSAGFAPKKCLP
jgi:hypothetical protein